MKKTPLTLYKYRSFNTNTLRLLTVGEHYYASPCKFNDPLDCNPNIEIDVDRESVEKLCKYLLVDLYSNEYKKPEKLFQDYQHESWGNYRTDPVAQKRYLQIFGKYIKELLDRKFSSWGVFSLAERWNCPLMWSHYGDEHRGLCIEYSTNDDHVRWVKPVNYNQSRSIKISLLIEWLLHDSNEAMQKVLDIYFYSKAAE